MRHTKEQGINWRQEFFWVLISGLSGVALAVLYIVAERFLDTNPVFLALVCSTGFYLLGMSLRIQNQRGVMLTGRNAFSDRTLFIIFPLVGFIFGLLLLSLG